MSAQPARPGWGVSGTSEGLRWRLRSNHEQRHPHSAFTQLRRVSIPPRAPQLNCSTMSCAGRGNCTASARRLPSPAGARVRPGYGSPDELSCPVSAASPASAPAAAGRTSAAGGVASAGMASAAGMAAVMTPVVPARRAGVDGARPPAAGAVGHGRRGRRAGRPGPAAAAALAERHRALPVPGPARTRREQHDRTHDEDEDDAGDHGVTLLPFPRSGPPWTAVPEGCPAARKLKAELRNFRGFSRAIGP